MHRKFMVLITVILTSVFLVVPMQGLLPPQNEFMESMPEDNGKKLVIDLCVGCHSIQTSIPTNKNEAGWRETINNMISRGAQIFDDESEIIVRYLTKYYGSESASGSNSVGPESSSAAAAQGSSAGTQGGGDQEEEGQRLVAAACVQCHSLRPLSLVHVNRDEWERIVYDMISLGAPVFPDEVEVLVRHLARSSRED